MLTVNFQRNSIRVLSLLCNAVFWFSTALPACAEEDGAQPPTPSTIQAGADQPPVEQTLVPEGAFAIQLAEALKLGPVANEAKAEELLSNRGIEPKNGWIAEYPVTPAVLGDIEKEVALASDQGKIPVTNNQALKLVGDLKIRLGLNVNPGADIPANLKEKPANTTIYSYTDDKGMIYYTDVYESIPQKYLSKVKIMSRPAS